MINKNDVLECIRKRKNDLVNWSVSSARVQREENYLIKGKSSAPELDQNRRVDKTEISIEVSVSNSPTRIGTASTDLNLYKDLDNQVDNLIQRAHLSSEQTWIYPAPALRPAVMPKTCFEGFERNLLLSSQVMVDEFAQAVIATKGAEFNSAELFTSLIERTRDLSSGFSHSTKRSKIYTEVCFSAASSTESNEFLVTRMGATPNEIAFRELCNLSAEGARALLTAEKVPSGKLSLLVDSEVLGQIFSDALTHLDANNCYFHLPFMDRSESFIPNYKGDPYTLILDPTLDYGFGSHPLSAEGWPQDKTTLVENNIIKENIVSCRMSQYLDRQPTLSSGNIVIESSGHNLTELRKKGNVLEVMQFSALFSSPQDLTFSSELRLGRLWEDGKMRYVKGGNVSGSFKENFNSIQFSNERILRNLNEESLPYSRAYKGPSFGLLNEVTVSS